MRLAPAECEDGLCSPIKTQNMLKTWRSSAAKDKLSPRTALFTGWLLLSLPAALFTEQAQRTPDPQAQNGADLRSVCYFPLMSSTSQENASNPLLLPHLKVASLFPDHGHFAFLLSSVPRRRRRGEITGAAGTSSIEYITLIQQVQSDILKSNERQKHKQQKTQESQDKRK